jgi:DNA transformation protein and related proteins
VDTYPIFAIQPKEMFDDREWLSGLLQVTADALPPPHPKKPRKKRS